MGNKCIKNDPLDLAGCQLHYFVPSVFLVFLASAEWLPKQQLFWPKGFVSSLASLTSTAACNDATHLQELKKWLSETSKLLVSLA